MQDRVERLAGALRMAVALPLLVDKSGADFHLAERVGVQPVYLAGDGVERQCRQRLRWECGSCHWNRMPRRRRKLRQTPTA